MELQAHRPIELGGDLLLERAVGIEPRHLVFVLVGHQLEQIARDRFRKPAAAGSLLRLGQARPLDPGAIAKGINGILISREKFDPAAKHLLERLRQPARLVLFLRRGLRRRLDRGRIDDRAAAPAERRLVHGHRLAVERDRFLDRGRRQRDRAELIGIADEENVGADRIAEQRVRKPRGVDEMALIAAGGGHERALEPLGRQREIGIACEVAGQEFGEIDDHLGEAGLRRRQHLLAAGHHDVAAEHELGAAGRHADGVDVLRPLGNAHVAVDRPALLREAGHVDDADALAFEMRRHPEDAADRHDAGAADAGDDDVVGAVDRRELRVGQRAEFDVLDGRRALLQLRAVHGDEGRAEAAQAGVVLVAAGLVDAALAAELGLERLHRHAVRLHTAIAAALAHELVDDHALVGIGIGTALAAAALFGGAGLVVNEHRDAGDRRELRLHLLQVVAMVDGKAAPANPPCRTCPARR